MRNVVVTDPPKADLGEVGKLAVYGVATVHEALGRSGFLGPRLRPVHLGTRIGGTAVTVLCWPGDNLMVHVAVEQCRDGDILVVTTTSPCTDAMLGELLVTSLQVRGVRGAVIDGGVRDVAEINELGFPVWSAAVSAQGAVKTTPGAVNVPVVVGGQVVCPGDAVIADDDGVLCVPRAQVGDALAAAQARSETEVVTRAALLAGELTLDRNALRPLLQRAGVEYLTAAEYARDPAR
jgi:4-hydroxy-4-methyl-2-oxoglutarate aldolase